MSVTLQEVEDALASVPATDGVLVVQVQEGGSIRKLAHRDGVPNYPGHVVVLNGREDAAARLRTASRPVSRPSQPVDPASRGISPPPTSHPVDRASEHAVWFVVGALVGAVGAVLWRRLDAPSLVVAGEGTEPPTGTDKNPRLAAAGRRGIAASGLNSKRFTCKVCGYGPTTAGPLGVHHKAAGHRGRVKA